MLLPSIKSTLKPIIGPTGAHVCSQANQRICDTLAVWTNAHKPKNLLLSRLDHGAGCAGLRSAAYGRASLPFDYPTTELVAEFTGIESGKKNNRPKLAEAFTNCKRHKATLVIAKLDRLARNVHFVSCLMETKINFVACDNPHANRLMVHMLAAFAEHEREMINQRTKDSLQAAKARGVVLGGERGTHPETLNCAQRIARCLTERISAHRYAARMLH
jgi:hypothetical protein